MIVFALATAAELLERLRWNSVRWQVTP